MFNPVGWIVLIVFILPSVLKRGWRLRLYIVLIGLPLAAIWTDHWIASSRASYDGGFGAAMGVVIGIFVTASFVLGLLFRAIAVPLNRSDGPPGWIRTVVMGAILGTIAWFLLLLLEIQIEWTITVVATILVCAAIRAISARSRPPHTHRTYDFDQVLRDELALSQRVKSASHEALWWIGGLLVCALPYSIYVMISFKAQAIELAGTEPFCIQVAGAKRYEEPTSRVDMLGLWMRGHGALNHAVLVVGSLSNAKLFHWSYRNNAFMPGAFGEPPIYCTPRKAFFDDLGGAAKKKDVVHFYHGGTSYSIPPGYSPDTRSAGEVTLLAIAPTFVPAMGEMCGKQLCHFVDFGFSPRMLKWTWGASESDRVEDLGEVHGLKMQRITSAHGSRELRYFIHASDKADETVIRCFEGHRSQCNHAFQREGITYSFKHMAADLPQWRVMQRSLYELRKSFIVGETSTFQ